MYSNVYQEYINNMLGGTYQNPMNFENTFEHNTNYRNQETMNLERLYPDLYKLLYPMVQKACMKNTKPLSEAVLEEMTSEIYSNFVSDEDATFLNINLNNEVRSSIKPVENKIDKTSTKSITSKSEETRSSEKSETRNVRPNNNVLRDLIRILLIRELMGRPQRPPTPQPPPPMRPGFPGGPRPPFRTNDFSMSDYELYENPAYMYSNVDQGYNIF